MDVCDTTEIGRRASRPAPRTSTHMKIFFLVLVWFAGVAFALAAETKARDKTADEERWRRLLEGPHVRRGKLPAIRLQRSITTSPQEEAQVKKLIADLAQIEHPDFGLSGTMGGVAFAPVAGSGKHLGGFLLTDHQLQTSESSRQLVALGPRALPFLLEALDDKTPTKLKQRHDGMFGGMFLCAEMDSNPTNSIEQDSIASLPKRERFSDNRAIRDYSVTVGDVCFVIIGQIVGRAYMAVRYQPTAIIVINSPVQEKGLAKTVREIWSSTNAAQRLFDSLLFDYATEGIFNGESLDGWSIASGLQCGAALRLLYYFPQETSGLIAERLARLDVRKPPEDRAHWMDPYLTNGVRAEEFIKAVAWSDAPNIRREILDIFKRTTDSELLLEALAGLDAKDGALANNRLNQMIDLLPAEEMGPYGDGYKLLVALGEKLGSEAKPTFIRYLQNASLQRWRSMAQVLRRTRSEWAAELLSPALTNKRDFGWTYAVVPDQNEPRRPIRVCDEAAETISLSRPELPFKLAGEHEDLDRQIAAMRARLEAGKR
jgi:hypothetical protein